MTATSIYQDIAARTGGDIYIGVVGPVRTGKSTLIKRLMEQMVLPNIEDPYRQERARDELPQSGSGKTIMTAEPKFIPEEAVSISPDGTATLSVRFIDSVGYLVPGAMGATEDGAPRMVTTPWFDQEIPMAEAAELGTKKVMDEHCTIGILVTTDGTIGDIPREDYLDAERRAITDLKATGKPFVVVVNSLRPAGEDAEAIRTQLEQEFSVPCMCADCLTMDDNQLRQILRTILSAFPISELQFFLPRWLEALEVEHPLKSALYEAMRQNAQDVSALCQAEGAIAALCQLDDVEGYRISSIDYGKGIVTCELLFPETLFYQILGEKSGLTIENDGDLMRQLAELAKMKQEYDKVAAALEEVRATGYGVVMPTADEMQLETPEIIRKGGTYGIKLRASAPSIHMMRADIHTEISPMVGDEKQSQELIQYLLGECEEDAEKLWQSNIFGKSVYDLISDGLTTKITQLPQDSRFKFKNALSRIINEGGGGLICIIL